MSGKGGMKFGHGIQTFYEAVNRQRGDRVPAAMMVLKGVIFAVVKSA
jgi:hypothetical protein